ncbi:MAG: endonuclease/exonuclease/phosphatase family protein [Chloroflexota bacterium]
MLSFITAVAGLASILGFFGRFWWVFDLVSHFRLQYFGLLLINAVLFLLGRRPRPATVAGLVAAVNFLPLLPFLARTPREQTGDQSWRALFINVNRYNRAYARIHTLIGRLKPDFVILAETDAGWLPEFEKLQADYPYWHGRLGSQSSSGVYLFSRIPLQNVQALDFGLTPRPLIVAQMELDGRPFTLIGAHPHSPTGPLRTARRNRQMAELAQYALAQPGEVMVMGDLNISPWSPFFQQFIRTSGLRDGRRGFGLKLTWPTIFPFLRIPIDHCLTSAGVTIHRFDTGPFIGFDHFPIVVHFSTAPPKQ